MSEQQPDPAYPSIGPLEQYVLDTSVQEPSGSTASRGTWIVAEADPATVDALLAASTAYIHDARRQLISLDTAKEGFEAEVSRAVETEEDTASQPAPEDATATWAHLGQEVRDYGKEVSADQLNELFGMGPISDALFTALQAMGQRTAEQEPERHLLAHSIFREAKLMLDVVQTRQRLMRTPQRLGRAGLIIGGLSVSVGSMQLLGAEQYAAWQEQLPTTLQEQIDTPLYAEPAVGWTAMGLGVVVAAGSVVVIGKLKQLARRAARKIVER